MRKSNFLIFVSLLSSLLLQAQTGLAKYSGDKTGKMIHYYVPVEDQDLAPFATYEFSGKWKVNEGKRSFEYDLPVELTGNKIEIELNETTPGIFVGPHAKAECQENAEFTCVIQYSNLVMDQKRAEEAIQAKFSDGTTIDGKTQVMRFFTRGSDPIGILTFKD